MSHPRCFIGAGVRLACLKHANVLADIDRTMSLNDFFYMVLELHQLVLGQDSD